MTIFVAPAHSVGRVKKVVLVAAVASLSVARFAFAIPIQLNLGPQGVLSTWPPLAPTLPRFVSFPAPDVQFQGQNIAVDFSFQNSEFIRLFTQTKYFELVVDFRVNDAPFPQIFSGTGYITDSQGVALGSQTTLETSVGTNGANQVNIAQFVLVPSISNVPPVDIYGFHFDLTLPNSPGFGFASGTFGAVTLNANTLGIGPKVPPDVISETGRTIGLLGLGLTALVAARLGILHARTFSDKFGHSNCVILRESAMRHF